MLHHVKYLARKKEVERDKPEHVQWEMEHMDNVTFEEFYLLGYNATDK
jgi:hypothetical protein